MTVTLLGPQRRPTVDRVVRAMGVSGPVATVTAGWQERESDDAELDEQLDGRSVNLRLYERWRDVQERDPDFAAATRRRRDELLELRQTYLVRLGHALAAVHDLAPDVEETAGDRHLAPPSLDESHAVAGDALTAGAVVIDRGGGEAVSVEVGSDLIPAAKPQQRRAKVRAEARAHAIGDVRRIDAEHLARLDEHNAEFIARWAPHERDAIARHRAEVAADLDGAAAWALAGGHVGVLLALLHLFAVDPPRRLPIVAWSAGAMVLMQQVVLYHDRAVHGPTDAEVYGRGLSIVQGTVALPHAKTRLLLDDTDRMGVLAARFAPARCVLLDPGARLRVDHDGELQSAAVVLHRDGRHAPTLT